MPSPTEYQLRQKQIKAALLKAYEMAIDNKWFECMSAIQEAEIITRVVLDQQDD